MEQLPSIAILNEIQTQTYLNSAPTGSWVFVNQIGLLYLANRELIDAYLKEGEEQFNKLQQSLRETDSSLYHKLVTA